MTERHSKLLALIRIDVRSARSLASQLGVSIRTVYRDIAILRGDGHAIVATVGRRGGFHLGFHGSIAVALTPPQLREIIAALLAARHRGLRLTQLDIGALVDSLLRSLPGPREATLRALFAPLLAEGERRLFTRPHRCTAAALDQLELAAGDARLAMVGGEDLMPADSVGLLSGCPRSLSLGDEGWQVGLERHFESLTAPLHRLTAARATRQRPLRRHALASHVVGSSTKGLRLQPCPFRSTEPGSPA